MQPLSWYVRRFRMMSPAEVAWRVRTALRGQVDRRLLARRQRPRDVATLLRAGAAEAAAGFRVSEASVGAWAGPTAPAVRRAWCGRLAARAAPIAAGRLSFFDLQERHLGDPIDWNRDHKSGRRAPLRFAPSIDYRDFRVTGDCKFVWEPNRHHQLVVLARAYRAGGRECFARAAATQLQSWLAQCPYGVGMNWRSPLELAVRLINWVWTIDLIAESGALSPALRTRLLDAVQRHLWEIARNYSRSSSAGNHLIGEAAGVFIASSYFADLKRAERWRAESRAILEREILRQTFGDGGGREQALSYQLFIMQFFLLAGVVARRTGADFSPAYWSRLRRMFEFVAALGAGGPALPMFGDCDDGYVLDLDADPHDVRPWLAAGALLLADPELNVGELGETELVHWLPGVAARAGQRGAAVPASGARLRSHAFPDSGYYLLQCGRRDDASALSVVFDCGPHGLAPLAGHGHADALAFTLRAFGRDVLVDPGTYDYFSYPRWRHYFRGTRAHNTITVDGRDQSPGWGLFLWGRLTRARCLSWRPGPRGGRVVGEHEGYTRLRDPVIHRRTLELDGGRRELIVRDALSARGRHEAALYFHVAEDCGVSQKGPACFAIAAGAGLVTVELDPRLTVAQLRGSTDPPGGWVSRGYHRKVPATTLVGRCTWRGELALVTRIVLGLPQRDEQPACEREPCPERVHSG